VLRTCGVQLITTSTSYTRLEDLFIRFDGIYSCSTKVKNLSIPMKFVASAQPCLAMNPSLVSPNILRAGNMAHWKVAEADHPVSRNLLTV